MPIKDLFNRDENNDDEIEMLAKRVMALESKTNTLDVHMRQFAKFENELRSEAYTSKYSNNKSKETRKSAEKNALTRETLSAMENHIYSQVSDYVKQTTSPIQKKMNSLEERLSVMENNVLKMSDLIEKNLQQTMQLKSEMERIKAGLSPREEKPVVIRELKVDRIMLDKYEQNNNFGNLGIKNISGQLNIGATYGKSALPSGITDELIDDWKNPEEEAEQQEMMDESDSGSESDNGVDNESGDESKGESVNQPDNGADNGSRDESYLDYHGRGHSGYFAGKQQPDDDTDGFTNIPIE